MLTPLLTRRERISRSCRRVSTRCAYFLAAFAMRRWRVETLSRGRVSPASALRSRPSFRRSPGYSQAPPGLSFPAFHRYYETAKTAHCSIPVASVSLAPGSLCQCGCSLHEGTDLAPAAWTLVNRWRPLLVLHTGTATALPAYLDTPQCLCPALRLRSGLHTHGPRSLQTTSYCVHGGAAPLTPAERPQRHIPFRSSFTRLWHSLHTLRAAIAGRRRNVRFRVIANLSRAGLVTRRVSITWFICY